MKNTVTNTLSSFIMLQMLLGTFPLQAFAQSNQTVTAPGGAIRAWVREGKKVGNSLDISDDGKVAIPKRNLTTQKAIHGDENDHGSVDATKRALALNPFTKKIIALQDQSKVQPTKIVNNNCAECKIAKQKELDAKILPDTICSNDEKVRIEKERKNPKTAESCSWDANFKKSYDGVGIYQMMGLAAIALPVAAGLLASNTQCFADLAKTFMASTKKMLGAPVDFIKGIVAWAGPANKAANQSAAMVGNLSDEDIARAKEDAIKLSYSKLNLFEKALDTSANWLLQLGTDEYREILDCAKCQERVSALCKVMGMMGKDVFRNILIAEVAGIALKGLVHIGVGKRTISWGEKKVARFTTTHAERIATFQASRSGKIVIGVAKAAIKISSLQDDLHAPFIRGYKAVTGGVKRVFIKGGSRVEGEIAGLVDNSNILSHVPGEEPIPHGGKATLAEITDGNIPTEVGMPRPPTKEMKQAEAFLRTSHSGAGKKGPQFNTKGIHDASIAEHEFVNATTVKVETPNGPQYIQVKNAKNVDHVMPFEGRTGNSALVFNADGTVHLVQDGKIFNQLNKKEVDKMSALWKDEAKVDQQLVNEARMNAEGAGEKTANVSEMPPNGKGRWEMKMDCNGKQFPVWIEAAEIVGKAL